MFSCCDSIERSIGEERCRQARNRDGLERMVRSCIKICFSHSISFTTRGISFLSKSYIELCPYCLAPVYYSYGEVKSPGYLHIHKDKKGMNIPTGDPSVPGDPLITTVIDLRLIMDFKVPDKGKNKDNLELDLELAEEEIKLKYVNHSFTVFLVLLNPYFVMNRISNSELLFFHLKRMLFVDLGI